MITGLFVGAIAALLLLTASIRDSRQQTSSKEQQQ